MQPSNNKSDWQQPTPQPSGAPYVAPPVESPVAASPVVTMMPDDLPQQSPTVLNASAEDESIESQPALPREDDQPVHWQASEYIRHEKNAAWFVGLAIVAVAFVAIALFVLQSVTFAILIPVMVAALVVYSRRPPRILDYTLSRQGLHINDRLFSFAEFKSFGVVRDGEEYSAMLVPTKRFRPGVWVYFPEEAGEAIVDMLGARLPMQELHLDLVDQVIRKLRL